MHELIGCLLGLFIKDVLKYLETTHDVTPLIIIVVIQLRHNPHHKVPNLI